MTSTITIVLIYSAFITLGLPDGLMGVAWPSFRAYFNVPIDAVGLLSIFGTAGYFISSFFSGKLVEKLRVSGVLAVSCFLTGLVLLFYTVSPAWIYIVIAVFFGGLGGGAIDAGLNLYTAQNLSRRHMQWIHACWGLGITFGPFIMTFGLEKFHSWKPGYAFVGIIQVLLALIFLVSARSMQKSAPEKEREKNHAAILSTLSIPRSWLNMSLFFIQSGIELTLGLWAYTILTESRGVEPVTAGVLTGSFWGIFTTGRFLAGFYAKKINLKTLIYAGLFMALAGVLLLLQPAVKFLSLAGFVFTGFALAPVFPSLMSGTEKRMGKKHAANMVGMQMSAAALGSALMPALAGIIAKKFSPAAIPVYLLCGIITLISVFAIAGIKPPKGR